MPAGIQHVLNNDKIPIKVQSIDIRCILQVSGNSATPTIGRSICMCLYSVSLEQVTEPSDG